MEDPNNIRHCCPDHAPTPKEEYKHLPLEFYIGKHVKLAFPVSNAKGITHEHMWVKVIGLGKKEELMGYIDNDPIYADFQYKEHIEFMREEIEDLLGPPQ